jgi:hypothetical protein
VSFLVKKKGEEYRCEDCGLVVLIQNACECGDECELVCCRKPMKQVKITEKSTASKSKEAPSEKPTEKPKK